jgi:hypothetical protein
LTWTDIKSVIDADDDSLNGALTRLIDEKVLVKIENRTVGEYRVVSTFFNTYERCIRLDREKSQLEKDLAIIKNKLKKEPEIWIDKWKEPRNLDFSLDQDHFFLEGRHLDDFSKELIAHAKSSVIVVNPFIQNCDLSNTLIDVKKKGVNVRIITRTPQDRNIDHLERKKQYLSGLKAEGIELEYNEKVHAKIIVVDDSVAIVSSMNFYPDSSAGVSWEAGLITIHLKTVASILESIKNRAITSTKI